MTTIKHRFPAYGPLAIAPQALGVDYSAAPKLEPMTAGQTAVVRINGPLVQHRDPFFDSYEDIRERAEQAFKVSSAVVLALDSPGGLVTGVFDLAMALRSISAATRKPLVAFIDGQGTSAAYALAAACTRIYASASALVGSIGVVEGLIDTTVLDAASGLKFHVTTSGARKADGNPHVPISPEARAASQARVDALAKVFFDVVHELRGTPVKGLADLQGAVLVGRQALAAGLVDEVSTLDKVLADLRSPTRRASSSTRPRDSKGVKATMPEPKPPARAADRHIPTPTPRKVEEAMSARERREYQDRIEQKDREIAQLKAAQDEPKIRALLEGRPDLPKELADTLMDQARKGMPFARVKAVVDATPDESRGVPLEQIDPIDRAMGMYEVVPGTRFDGNTLHLGGLCRPTRTRR